MLHITRHILTMCVQGEYLMRSTNEILYEILFVYPFIWKSHQYQNCEEGIE